MVGPVVLVVDDESDVRLQFDVDLGQFSLQAQIGARGVVIGSIEEPLFETEILSSAISSRLVCPARDVKAEPFRKSRRGDLGDSGPCITMKPEEPWRQRDRRLLR